MRVSYIILVAGLIIGLVTGETSDTKGNSQGAPDSNLRGRKLARVPVAYYFGYEECEREWESGRYPCTSDGVRRFENSFSYDNMCNNKYPWNGSWQRSCRDGAKDLISDKKDECFASTPQCQGFGEDIADGIIATHCHFNSKSSGGSRKKWPEDCKDIAKKDCKQEVSDTSNYSCRIPSRSQISRYKDECDELVDDYLGVGSTTPGTTNPNPNPVRFDEYSAACRLGNGSDGSQENAFKKYYNQSYSQCKRKCANDRNCDGFEYRTDGKCEIWHMYPSKTSSFKPDYTCAKKN
mmetsp:Transcript_30183/g.61276  ORF Transcript_30183/g.61276 Transcript_30183/m.61276 type:complete len:293 (-) Transcript_30183:839-1717(-)|eukprot:CAMPEP_0178563614 /NCGR_PEP_ID=MMETSP0697-20121206/13170_1 /TAXON_ID=265572 /ORGANISM="Extubocellulus spinifer, Strain CCMP396" /LENGTH=292 /DNA_ID=CAMNT_0020197061 /DNA_START=87 /DNA_END=965 /DNA_ORIENTATION=+